MAQELAEQVEKTLEETAGTETPTVEQVQDTVEKVLIEADMPARPRSTSCTATSAPACVR